MLQRYKWPGNVRELQNVIERCVITAKNGQVRFDLPGVDTTAPPSPAAETPTSAILRDEEVRRLERENLLAALERADWKIYGPGGVAELLGLKPTTVTSRLKRMGIDRTEKS